MKECDTVQYIYYLFERSRTKARAAYKESFGVPHDDPSIDEELERTLGQLRPRSDSDTTITLPARLVLALVLRPHGRGKGRQRPQKERWAKRQEDLAIGVASERWAELIGKGVPSKTARHDAATETLADDSFEFSGLSIETLKNKMRLEQRKHVLKNRKSD